MSESKLHPRKNKPLCAVCLLGPPASGKGTCASFLLQHYVTSIISPGAIYRALREEDSETGRLVKTSLADGGYCPDYLTNKVVIDEIKKYEMGRRRNYRAGSILDGYPRSVSQLVCLLNECDVELFLHLDAPYEELLEAAVNRKTCAKCKMVYNLQHSSTWCKCTGSPLMETRFDDNADMFPKRYKTYMEATEPIIELISSLDNYRKTKVLFRSEGLDEVLDFMKLR